MIIMCVLIDISEVKCQFILYYFYFLNEGRGKSFKVKSTKSRLYCVIINLMFGMEIYK